MMADGRLQLIIRKNFDGRFGFSFDIESEDRYTVSKVASWVTQDIRKGDMLISVNGVTQGLEFYCKSEEALSMDRWQLVIERQRREETESLNSIDFSLYSGDLQDLEGMAISKPISVIWSDTFDIAYNSASRIDLQTVKFKKKEVKREPRREWILLQRLGHSSEFPQYVSATDTLQRGDWLLKLNGENIPFACPQGTTTWFCNHLRSLGDRPVTVTVRRPISGITSQGADNGENLESILSVLPSIVSEPGSSRPRPVTSKHRTNSGTSTSSNASDSAAGPRSLTSNPDDIRNGQRLLDRFRSSVELKPIERLGRCRVIFHHVCAYSSEITERLQNDIFGGPYLSGGSGGGVFLKEYHIHASWVDSDGKFSQPTSDDCYSAGGSVCDFEMDETVERVYEKTAASTDGSKSLSTLPNSHKSGHISMQSLRRYSTNSESNKGNKMHVQVLSVAGHPADQRQMWYSPIIYCKHSVNVMVVNAADLFSAHSRMEQHMARVFCEINAYTRDFGAPSDLADDFTAGKVLLILANTPNNREEEVKACIMQKLRPYHSMLIKTTDHCPFLCIRDVLTARKMLLNELRQISTSVNATGHGYIYPHAGVMLSQQLCQAPMSMMEISDLCVQLRQSIAEDTVDVDSPLLKSTMEATQHYLHNTGLAYIPELSYSASLGSRFQRVPYSLLLHPQRLVTIIDRLKCAYQQQSINERGVAPDSLWVKLLSVYPQAVKFVGILKELHIILAAHSYATAGERENMTLFPLTHYNPIGQNIPEGNPSLQLVYKNGLNFLLVTALLNYLSSKSISSSVDYHSNCGMFHIHHHSMLITRTTNTGFGYRSRQPTSLTDLSLSIYVTSVRPERCSTRGFTASLMEIIKSFHEGNKHSKDKPQFGPPCPLEERCTNGPFHVIDLLGRTTLSCSGESLERIDAVMDYVCNRGHVNTPGRIERREEVLQRPADQLPRILIEQLDEYSTLERNWIGLAKLESLNTSNIERVGATPSPAYSLLHELATHRGYTIEQLFKALVEMEIFTLSNRINDWIDQECLI